MKEKFKLCCFPFVCILYQILFNLSAEILFPAFYQIAEGVGTDIDGMQGVVPAWLAGISLPQLIIGPLIARFGKRATLLGGGLLFALSAYFALSFQRIETLWILRFLQGISNGAFMVAGYSAIGSLYESRRALRILAAVTAAAAGTQMFGSFLGSHLLDIWGWRSIFQLLFCVSSLFILTFWSMIPEMKGSREYRFSPRSIAQEYRALFSAPSYSFRVLASGFLYTGMILWSTSSPYFVLGLLGHPPDTLGSIQIAIYGGFILGAQLLHLVLKRWEVGQVIRFALGLSLVAALSMLLCFFFLPLSLPLLVIPMVVYEVGFGLAAAPFAQEVQQAAPAFEGSAMALYFFGTTGLGVLGSLVMSLMSESPLFFAAALVGAALLSNGFYFIVNDSKQR